MPILPIHCILDSTTREEFGSWLAFIELLNGSQRTQRNVKWLIHPCTVLVFSPPKGNTTFYCPHNQTMTDWWPIYAKLEILRDAPVIFPILSSEKRGILAAP